MDQFITMRFIIFLPIIAVLGVKTLVSDLRESKVSNRALLAAAILGLAGHVAIIAGIMIKGNPIPWPECSVILGNTVIAIIIGYGMWHYCLWSPGDAKLYIVLTWLVPMEFYQFDYSYFFPNLILLTNMFVPYFLWLLWSSAAFAFEGLSKSIREKKLTGNIRIYIGKAKTSATSASFINILISFVAVSVLMRVAREEGIRIVGDHIGNVQVFASVILVFLFRPISNFFRSTNMRYVAVGILAAGFLLGTSRFSMAYRQLFFYAISSAGIFMFVFGLCRAVIYAYLDSKHQIKVIPSNVAPGMFPEDSTKKKLLDEIPEIGTIYPEGLTDDQVRLIRHKLSDEIELVFLKVSAFVPSIILGTAMTLVLKRSVVEILFSLLRR